MTLLDFAAASGRAFRGPPPVSADHCEILTEFLTVAGCGVASASIAGSLIAETGSLAAAVSSSDGLFRRLQVPREAVRAIELLRAAVVELLRREVLRRPSLTCDAALLDYLHAEMAHGLTEQFRVLFLDSRNALIRDEVVAEGSVSHAPVYVRELMRRALELSASALILVHNHPSGDPSPSQGDVMLTLEIEAAAGLLGIDVHDHIVIGREGHSSLRGLGLMGLSHAA